MAAGSQSNISQYLPPGVGTTLGNIQNPKAFGEQTLDQGKQLVKAAALGIVEVIKQEIVAVTREKAELEINHRKRLAELEVESKPKKQIRGVGVVVTVPPTLNENEYQVAVDKENFVYEERKEQLRQRLEELKQSLKDIVLGPYKKYKDKALKLKAKREKRKARNKLEKKAADREKRKQFLTFAKKTLTTIIINQLTKVLIELFSNNSELQILVDKTNEQIEAANTLDTINQARMARNACIAAIERQEKKIKIILDILKPVQAGLIVLQLLTLILKGLAGAIGRIFNLLYEAANLLITGISMILSIVIPMLDTIMDILADLKRQLRDLNRLVEKKTVETLNDRQLAAYLNQIYNSSNDPLSGVTILPGESFQDYIDRLRSSPTILQTLSSQSSTFVPPGANQLNGEPVTDYINRLLNFVQTQAATLNLNSLIPTPSQVSATGAFSNLGGIPTVISTIAPDGTTNNIISVPLSNLSPVTPTSGLNLYPLPNESPIDYATRLRNLLAFLILLQQQNESAILNRLPGESDAQYVERMRSSPSALEFIANKTTSLNEDNLQNELNSLNPSVILGLAQQTQPANANNFPPYKGFRFQIKQENDPKFTVRGNKRHYAVAINRMGIEQIKSDYSFTLDPQQLVNQLKLTIDQQNLQG